MSRAGILPETPRESCRLGSSGALPRVRVHAPPPAPRLHARSAAPSVSLCLSPLLPLSRLFALHHVVSRPQTESPRPGRGGERLREQTSSSQGPSTQRPSFLSAQLDLGLREPGSSSRGEEWRVSSRFEASRLHKPWRPRCPRRFTLSCLPRCPVRLLGVKRNGVDSGELGCGVQPVDLREAWVLC